jgi:hypothetical protein
MKRYCKTCGLLASKQQICQLFGHKVDPAADFCSRYKSEVATCDFCHKPTINPIIELSDGTLKHTYCHECLQQVGTCPTCSSANTCTFNTDPSSIPKYIQQPIRQGNMIITTNVMNPERIAITCQKGCHCYSPENGCMRQNNNTCENYDN